MNEEVLTTKQARTLLRVSRQTFLRLVEEQKIPHKVISKRGDRRFLKQDILNYMYSK